jgi:hypothetical protein
MTKSNLLAIGALAAGLAGCCDEHVEARAFVGHLTEAECLRNISKSEPPISIICPGTEVTICWASKGVSNVGITVSPDPGGVSGSFPDKGALHLMPSENTTVDVKASDCASTEKDVMVINGPTPATFDAHWDSACHLISYELSTAFVDPKVQTIDVAAMWEPTVLDPETKAVSVCPTPPFLAGAHPEDVHFFDIDKPFLTHAFSRILKAPVHWNYEQKTCVGPNITCNPYASLPFDMTLVCPAK